MFSYFHAFISIRGKTLKKMVKEETSVMPNVLNGSQKTQQKSF